ncbi:MAG: twin-arginine translocase TatA/TatE family subunit [Armatimonadota bacterium]
MPLFALLNTQTLIIVLVVALVVFGPHKLPEIGRQLGNAMRELRKMSGDMQRALDLDGHSSSSYDYYSSSNYDSSSSYQYTPPADTPLDQYGLDDGHAPALEAAPGDSEAQSGVEEAASEKPKRTRRKKAVAEGGADEAVAEQPSAESVDGSIVEKPRRSRKRVSESDSESSPSTDVPKPRRRRTATATASESAGESSDSDVGGEPVIPGESSEPAAVESVVIGEGSEPENPVATRESATSPSV